MMKALPPTESRDTGQVDCTFGGALKTDIYAHNSPSFQQWEPLSNVAKETRSPYKARHHHQAQEEEEGPTWRFVF